MLLLSFWAILLAILCTFNDEMAQLFPSKKKGQDN